ncbi:zinc-binding dehydrogenase [Elongatibacter sediminis]|uniref:Zinc-binding dehydrogenase n=1 Tax=Elongatibacter sediminis TaxID=3119006 RepID=A0AAW9R6B8_9GAMM
MRAVRMHEHGGPEVLRVEEVPEPVPGAEDLLVRMRATTVNHRDVWIRKGHPHPAYRVDLPAILGIDISGEIVDKGSEVEGFAVGERVTANPYIPCGKCGYCIRGHLQNCPRFSVFNGAYAELVTIPARQAVKLSAQVSNVDAACFPNTYITAWQMLMGKAALTPDDIVFVWAGTSGLGSAAIQIARLAGATVIASAGGQRKLDVLRGLGPDFMVDHYRQDVVERVMDITGGEGASVVFEHVGQATWERSLELASPGGRIVSAGATSGDDVHMDVTRMFVKQLRILGSRLGTMEDALAAGKHLNAGHFKPLVGATIPFEEISEAHRLMEAGKVIGKVVVTAD